MDQLYSLPQLLILFFLLVTFLISIIEKLSDWKGTIAYMSNSFKNTFIISFIKPLVVVLVFLEIFTVYFVSIGMYELYFYQEKETALLGSTFSCFSILYMLIGQRIAKDYPGATSLTVYFILSVFGVYLLN
jgi:putative oxidoreductase